MQQFKLLLLIAYCIWHCMYRKPITNHISQKRHVNGANFFEVTVLHIGYSWANKIALL